MEQKEYYEKKQKVIDKFSAEFLNGNYNTDAAFRNILEMLIMDANPYELIEKLIEDRKAMFEQFKKLIEKMPVGFKIDD